MSIANQIKTVLLLGLLTAILIGVGGLLGGRTGLFIGLVLAILMNFFSYWYSDKFVLFIYKAQEAPKSKYSKLHSIVEKVAKEADIPKPKVYIVPSQISNAFATGPNPKRAVVAVTQGILSLLSENELKGVIAHEIAHIKNRDILISTIAATIAGVISYVAMMAKYNLMFSSDRERSGGANIIAILLLAIITPIIALIIQLAISRTREYFADTTGAKLVKDPISLANALAKLHASAIANPLRQGNPATAHMFIVNPFSASTLMSLLSTHPPVESRIQRLKEMKI